MPVGVGQAAGMGLGVIGGQMQGWAALLDKWAVQNAYQTELDRQAAYQQAAMGTFNQQLGQSGYAGAQSDMANAYASRLANYNAINQVPLGFNIAGQGSASPARDAASANMMGQQRANLQKYGDYLQNQKVRNMQTGRTLDQLTNFAAGQSRNVYPYELYSAQHSMDALANIGAAISSAGGALSGGKVGGPLGQQQFSPGGGGQQPTYGYPGGMSSNDFWNQYFAANYGGAGSVDPYFGAGLLAGV